MLRKEKNENEELREEYSIRARPAAGKKAYRRALVVLAVVALLMFGAGMKYARYLEGQPLLDVTEAGDILQTSGFGDPVASSDVVVKVEGAAGKTGYFSLSGSTTLRELVEYVGVAADGDTSDFDFTHKPETGETYYIKSRDNPVDATEWLTASAAASDETEDETETAVSAADEKKVNLNTATLEELKTLDGIGDTKGQAIIDYREKNGGFQRIEDILAVKGIGEKTYEKLKDRITV